MCSAVVPRSHIGDNDSGTHTKRTLRRCTKEDDAANGTELASKSMSCIAFDGSQDIRTTLDSTSSSSSLDTIRFLQSVRRHLGAFDTAACCPVPPKAASQQAAKNHTGSPIKSPSRKSGPRSRQLSGSLVELGPDFQAKTTKKCSTRKISERLDISSQSIPVPRSQIDAPTQYAPEDLNVQIRCYERHVTTWDVPDYAFFIFPAQLLITCTSKRDFDPLVIPHVSIINLVCATVAMGGPSNLHRPLSFSTFYDGAIISYVNKEPTCHLTRGIHVEGVSSESWSSTMNGDGDFGWYMRFWIPIPFVLFQRAETRGFKIDVKVHINGAGGQEGHLTTSSDFTLTRLLRSEVM